MALPTPLQNLSGHARWLYPLTVLVAAVGLGQFFGLGLGLLVFAGGTLGGSIWLIWASLQGLGGEAPITLEEALSLGAPSAEEEQKRAVLRALKDLEYERAVGKISEEDYASLAEHYRAEAKRLLRVVDKDLSPERERAERLLAERLANVGVAGSTSGRSKKRAATKTPASDSAVDEASEAAPGGDDAQAAKANGDAEAKGAEAKAEPAQDSKSPSSDAAP